MNEMGLRDPKTVVKEGFDRVFKAVRISGLGKMKAERILKLSEFLASNEDFLEKICVKGEEARKELMKLEGIGPKTADVFLLTYCGIPAFPVDRHISRVTQRVAGKKMKYDEISAFWKEKLPREMLGEAHLKLINIGRKYCRPINPRCDICPLKEFCASRRK